MGGSVASIRLRSAVLHLHNPPRSLREAPPPAAGGIKTFKGRGSPDVSVGTGVGSSHLVNQLIDLPIRGDLTGPGRTDAVGRFI